MTFGVECVLLPKLFPVGRKKFAGGLGSGAHMEFMINVPEMPPDGPISEAEPGGDVLVRETSSHQFEDLAFTLRKTFHLRGRGHRLLEGKNNLAGDLPGHRSATLADLADVGNEFFGGGTF